MKFPVDLLADVGQEELEQSAHSYMNNLLYSSPDSPEHLTVSDSTQVAINISSVGFIPLYGSSDKQKILALFSPSDPFTAVALYLLDQWWTVDDILKTADAAQDGALEVKTVGERIVLYILNRFIYRAKEMSSEELPFLCHGEKDYAKILWSNGEAVGFYSVKPSGSLCNSFSTRTYQLPVMDSMYVRKCQRGKGFGLQMLEDFVLSFKEDYLGLRYPLTKSMYKVCEKYLCQYPGDIDLLWEVGSIGAPNQRTSIGSKIQAMHLGAVSKSPSFTEESLLITEVTEKTAERETLTTQTKEAGSMECTVEIVEEVTVLRATKVSEAEDVAVAVRGRSSGSKRRNITEKPPENKSEKVCIKDTVIRIEDIEPETPRQQQVSVHHVSELEQTEGMFSVAAEEKGEDIVHTIPEDESVMLDKPATVPLSQDLKEADVIAALMTEVPQVDDDVARIMKNESQIIVENVASEIEEAEEECQKEDTEELVSSEEPLEVHKKAEALDKVGEGTEIKISKEKSEEIITQHEVSLSTHTTSEDVEAERTVKTVVRVIKLVQNETHRQRSQQHSKLQDTAHDRGRVLRRRTVSNTPTPKRKCTRHSQNTCEELEKEVNEEENNGSAEVVEELAVTERKEQEDITSIKEDIVTVGDSPEDEKQQHEDEQLTHKKEEEPELGDSVVKKSSTAQTALKNKEGKVTDETEKEQNNEGVETSLIQDKQETSDDEMEESPAVLKRAVRGRHKVSPKPKPRKQSKRYQNQEEHTDQAGLRKGGSAEAKADEQAAEEQIEEHHTVEQETVDKTEEEKSTMGFCESVVIEATIPMTEEAAEDVLLSTEMNMEECKEVQEEEETERETKIVSVADNEEEADNVTSSQTAISDEVRDEAGSLGAEGPQDRNIGSEIPKLQKATVILVDFKTTYHHLSVNEAEEKTFDGKCVAREMEQMELIAAEEKQVSSCVAEEQTSEPQMPMLEEEDQEKQGNITENSVDATAEVETVKKEELEENNAENQKDKSASMDEKQSEAEEALVLETRVLQSGRKNIDTSCKARERSNQQKREENIGEGTTEKEVAEADTDTVEVEGEMDAVTVIVPVEEKESVSEICADIPVGYDAEEAPVVETRALRSGTKTVTATPAHKTRRRRRRRKHLGEQEAQNSDARTQRRGRISVSATPKSKSRSTQTNSKQIRKEEQKEEEESKSVKDTRVEEVEILKEAAAEQTNEEGEEKTEEIGAKVMEEVASEREESLELEMDVQEGKVMAEEEQNVEENQSEVTSKTFAEREAEASSENYNDRKPVVGIEGLELPPAVVTRSLRSGGKTSKAPPKARSSRKQEDEEKEEGEASAEKSTDGEEPPVETRFLSRGGKSVSRSRKQLQEKTEESAEEAEVEEQEAVLGSDKEPPTDRDKRNAQEEDRVEVEKGELVTAEEVSEKGTMSMTEEEENTAEVTAAAGDLVQEETDPALAKPDNDTTVFTPREEEAILSTEEQQSKEKTSLLSDLQSVTVVLVDLKKGHHDIQGETATVEDGVLVEKTYDTEEEQKGGIMKEKEKVAERHIPGSPAEIEKTDLEKVVLEEEGLEEEVEDVVTIQENTGRGSVEETEAKIVDDDKEELKVTETRKLRSRKHAAKATSRHKSTSRQKQGKEEKKAASEISKDEPVTHIRALGGGGGSIPVAQRCRTRTQKQLQEEKKGEGEGREGSTGVEEREAEEEEYIEEQHTTQEIEKVENMRVEKADTMAEEAVTQDAPEEEQAGTTETVADENTEAPAEQTADDRKTSYDVARETVTTQYAVEEEQSITTSKGAETAAAENAQNTLLITKHDEARGVSDQEEYSVSETIILRSGEKAVRAKPQGKATKKQDDEQEVEAAGEKSTEDEPAVETRVLRKGRTSAPATPRNRSKRARTQCQPEEEAEGVTTPAEETEGEETKAGENEKNSNEKIEEMDDEEVVAQKESFTEHETPSTNKGNITEEEEAAVEPRVLRSGHKSADTGKPAETRLQRKGRRTAPATPRLKSKRAHTHCQPEQEATPSEETEGEEEVAREESPEEKGERAEGGEKWKEMEVEKKDLEEVQVKSAAGGESVVDTFTEETAVLEKEHNRVAAVDETNTDTLHISTAKVERTTSTEEEEFAVIEKSTAATEMGSDTTTAEEEALTEDAYVVAQEEAPVVTRRLMSKTKTPHATPSGGLKRQKDQGVLESQQQEDENPEDEKIQEEVHPLTDDIVECREINVKEQAEAEETSSTGEEAKPLVEDTAEHQAKEKVDLIYNRGLEPEKMEIKEDKTVGPSVEGRNLRRRKKTTSKDKDKVEEIQLPKRRSIRKRPRVDYRENNEEEEEGETEAATDREEEEEVDEDEDEVNREAECSANEQVEKLVEDNKNENLEKDMGAIERTSEKGDILNLVLDTDEEVETAALSQEHEEDEQNISEEEVEPTVIDKRVLRGRSVPSVIITPHSKPRCYSAKVKKSEDSLSDEEKSPRSAQKRSVHKRKSTEVPPTRKSKRYSRV